MRIAFLALPLIAAVGAASAQSAPLYRVTLATPAAASALVVKDLRWACVGNECTAPRAATSPDAHVCSGVVRKLGRVTAFASGEKAFEAAALEKCNAAAQ